VIGPDKKFAWDTDKAGDRTAVGPGDVIYTMGPYRTLNVYAPDGTLKWKHGFKNSEITFMPAVGADGTVYVSTTTGRVCALTADGVESWEAQCRGKCKSGPAIGPDGMVYVVSGKTRWKSTHTSNCVLQAFAPDGKLSWATDVETATLTASPGIGADGSVYVGLHDGLAAVDPGGVVLWTAPLDGPVTTPPVVAADGTIYVVSSEAGRLYALELTGAVKWEKRMQMFGTSSPAIGAKGTIYVGTADARLCALDPEGVLLWSFRARGGFQSSPGLTDDGVLFAASDDGRLHSFAIDDRPAASPWPMWGANARRTWRAGRAVISGAAADRFIADTGREGVKWLITNRQFVVRRHQGKTRYFREFLAVRGIDKIKVNGLAFGRDHVWAATDRGAFCYERKKATWTEYAVNREHIGEPVESVNVGDDGRAGFTMKLGSGEKTSEKTFFFDPATASWTEK